MSGHSKWSKIKRQKASGDVKKGKEFTKVGRAITLAVAEGNGITDPTQNFKLRLAFDQAKRINMPKDTIMRAVERGSGKGENTTVLKNILYEAYGPFGIAILIDVATDNTQRTAAQLKHTLERGGGHLSTPGSVAFQFEHRGIITVDKKSASDEVVLDIASKDGVLDIEDADDVYELYTNARDLHTIKTALEQQSMSVTSADLVYRPKQQIYLTTEAELKKVIDLLEQIEDLDDVLKTYANFEAEDTS